MDKRVERRVLRLGDGREIEYQEGSYPFKIFRDGEEWTFVGAGPREWLVYQADKNDVPISIALPWTEAMAYATEWNHPWKMEDRNC